MTKSTQAATVDFQVSPPADWPEWRRLELEANTRNGRVGSKLVSTSPRVRVWHIVLKPGERIGFHRHVLDYFWTATRAGRSRSHSANGDAHYTSTAVADTGLYTFAAGESMIHDLENIGDTVLSYVTVELLDSSNEPLPL
jgi:hypothetical protein